MTDYLIFSSPLFKFCQFSNIFHSNSIRNIFRCNLVGQDLNRAWADTNKYMHSEIVDIKRKLVYYDNHSRYDLGIVH